MPRQVCGTRRSCLACSVSRVPTVSVFRASDQGFCLARGQLCTFNELLVSAGLRTAHCGEPGTAGCRPASSGDREVKGAPEPSARRRWTSRGRAGLSSSLGRGVRDRVKCTLCHRRDGAEAPTARLQEAGSPSLRTGKLHVGGRAGAASDKRLWCGQGDPEPDPSPSYRWQGVSRAGCARAGGGRCRSTYARDTRPSPCWPPVWWGRSRSRGNSPRWIAAPGPMP